MKAKKIIVLGSCNTDMVIQTARLPVPGETIIGGEFMMTPGGKGANQAVAASRLGGNVTFITKIGNDVFGRQSLELYQNENINTDHVFLDPNNPSGVALITVDNNAENCIVVASGANKTLSKEDVDKCREEIESADILLIQLEIPLETVEYAAEIAYKAGVKVIVNPAPASFLPDNLFKNTHMIIPNMTEAEILSGVKVFDWNSAKTAADVISKKGVDIVIITLGILGALLKENGTYHEIPIEVKVKAVDTTAAGDTFCGALCVAISEGTPLTEAIRFANRAAGLSVTKMGAQVSIPYRKDIVSP
ncbi:ribokinase [Dysgonomonas sp. Marseille-P4677]|uniref:ribokinase n=1 Tax=Dysgonomonas sp. Marseille-P4677 TaxID=2364790 RepID=UPI00191194AB|nr:ribokinase [Dysgonomonas sp. Marseille-P4677]MBK5722363.1 ribokinase [Dysgonomonas sp. Marseille-P4677]